MRIRTNPPQADKGFGILEMIVSSGMALAVLGILFSSIRSHSTLFTAIEHSAHTQLSASHLRTFVRNATDASRGRLGLASVTIIKSPASLIRRFSAGALLAKPGSDAIYFLHTDPSGEYRVQTSNQIDDSTSEFVACTIGTPSASNSYIALTVDGPLYATLAFTSFQRVATECGGQKRVIGRISRIEPPIGTSEMQRRSLSATIALIPIRQHFVLYVAQNNSLRLLSFSPYQNQPLLYQIDYLRFHEPESFDLFLQTTYEFSLRDARETPQTFIGTIFLEHAAPYAHLRQLF